MHAIRLCAVVTAACAGAVASADTLISNLNATDGGGTLFGPTSTAQFKAAGFVLNDDYFLDGVTLAITDPDAGSDASVSIWTGAGTPQALLANLASPTFNGSANYSFTPGGQVTLTAGTQYWVYVDNIGEPNTFNWDSGDALASGPGGAGTGYIFNGNPSTFLNRFAIEGTLVPAPGVAVLMGVAGLSATRRRR